MGLAGFAAWTVVSAWRGVLLAGASAVHALWLLPALVALHLLQLLLSARAWHLLLPPGLALLRVYRIRLVREGIDALLPVAQVGGEVEGARLLSPGGPSLAVSGASIVVDVTTEFLSQLVFLLAGLGALAATSGARWQAWVGTAFLTAAGACGLLAAQRFGVLRLVEGLARRIAARWPAAASLAGIDEAASAIYRRRLALLCSTALHLLAWALGSIESWAVLHALGLPASPVQAVIVEALGMAARSAGFAVPGALVVQEAGFALAAAAIGLPETAGVSLSLVKRVREVVVGLLGLGLWRLERTRRLPA